LQLSIEKLVYGGDGLARLPADEQGRGKAVFLPFVLEGEKVEAALLEEKPGFARARAEQILERSARRVEPPCPYFQRCGGCHYQYADYRHQLEIKAAILKENLRRIAKVDLDTELIVHASPEWNYRNRTRLKIQTQPQFALGYYRHASHELLPVEQCPISSPLINRAIAALWDLGHAGKVSADVREIEFFCNAEDDQFLLHLYCSPLISKDAATKIADDLRSLLPRAAGVVALRSESNEKALAEAQPIAVSGAAELTYKTPACSYRVRSGAFFQVNRHLIGELIGVVTGHRAGAMALDLYAGVGLFSTVLAGSFAQVIAVEASPTAHADLVYNSPSNVQAVHATTDQFLAHRAGKLEPDLVVLDPPRGGLGGIVVRSLAKLEVEQITYVSCDPATLSRDLAGLLAAGYRIQQAHLIDLFPQTYHVESVVHLIR
jgi:23S rRNA (uracil1939-C5)-methyltransferase